MNLPSKTFKLSAILIPIVCLGYVPVSAQTLRDSSTPVDVSICDLLAQPSKYNGELVRVRSQISFAFENFTLSSKNCPPVAEKGGAMGVWLEYGGDESTPAIYCCGDHGRKPGEATEVEGKRVMLLRDTQLEEFRKRIGAERQARPDGQMCQERECFFYDMTATITGHFLARGQTKDGEMIGYGHLGMSHLLFIEQISELDVSRTAVPAGGVFDCRSEPWTAPASVLDEILRAYRAPGDRLSFDEVMRRALTTAAGYGGKPLLEIERWHHGVADEAEHYWISSDLLTIFSFKFPFTNPNTKRSRSEFSATRTTCTPVRRPLPQSAKVNCETRGWQVEAPEPTAKGVQRAVDGGSDPWRMDFLKVAWQALRESAAKDSIALSSLLEIESCQTYPSEENEQGFCRWVSRDGMQSADMSLVRYGFLSQGGRTKDRTAWIMTGGGITTCKPD